MPARTSTSRRWWHRLLGSDTGRPYDLPDSWVVLEGPEPRTEIAVGPGGAFLLDHRRTPASAVARLAGEVSGHLTAQLASCIIVQGVLVEDAERGVRTDQPAGVTIVTTVVLGAWLHSHPTVFDEREISHLARILRPSPAPQAE